MSTRWFVARDNRMRFADWQGESQSIVYQISSGDLHLLNRSSAQLLSLLQEEPASDNQLFKRYSNLFDTTSNPLGKYLAEGLSHISYQALIQQLTQFRALGLIESVEL